MTETTHKIRILQIIGNLRFGGTQVVVKQIVEHTNPEHFRHIVYPLRARPNEMSIRGEVIEHRRFPYDIRKFFDLIRICREENIDIVHAHLYKSILGALLLTFFCPMWVIIHEHDPVFETGASSWIYRILLRLLYRRSAGIVANSRAAAHMLHRRANIPLARVAVIANAVDSNRFRHCPEKKAALRRQYRLGNNAIVVGFVGRLHPAKGVDCLIEAMRILVQHRPLFHLCVIGTGPLEHTLKQRVDALRLNDHIHFLGYQDDVSQAMNLFDIGCMPSRREAFGIAAVEMMCMKIPLVCSRVEGLAEITEHRKTALHLDRVSPEAIADSILELSENPELRRQLGDNGFCASQQYSIECFTEKIEALYRRIIQNRPS